MCQQECQQFAATANNKTNNKLKPSYSIKRVLQALFRKQQKLQQRHQKWIHPHHQQQQQPAHFILPPRLCHSLESLESLENYRNSQMEQHFYEEIEDNSANEKLAQLAEAEQEQEEDVYVPVRFARTQAGTFFWTTNLQPVTSTIAPAADEDLLQPAYCYSNYQYPRRQYQDRWAQA